MLEFTSLLLAAPVVYAQLVGDTLMHTSWLALLCTSLLHHASRGRLDRSVGRIDRGLCVLNAIICGSRLWPVTDSTSAACWVAGAYIVYVYYVSGAARRSNAVHVSIHVTASLIACRAVRNTRPPLI